MIRKIKHLCFKAIIDENYNLLKYLTLNDMDVSRTKNNNFGHFQFNSIMKISKILNEDSFFFANKIKEKLINLINNNEMIISITKPGFINFFLKDEYIFQISKSILKKNNYQINKKLKEKIIIDYSSPNIAKDMHVGHLRSTIIGECLSNVFKFFGHKVIKISHLGDWGTQFGILINYIENFYLGKDITKINFTLKKLSLLYKSAQNKFDNDVFFKMSAKKTVVSLQNNDSYYLSIWKKITLVSKREYKKIYSLLDINIRYKGESFYRHMLPFIIKIIEKNSIFSVSDGAKCVFLDGFKNKSGFPLPVIIQKSDGGYNYMTTDLAALYYRVKYNKANKILYITDVGQKDHFSMLFNLFNKLNLNDNNSIFIHVPLGLMLTNEGKKIKTRSGESKKLINFLKESVKKAKIINKNNFKSAEIIGINTVKYSELSNRIDQNYVFDFDKMSRYNGNTAVFIMYAYARIISIEKKNKKNKNINLKYFNFSDNIEDSELNILLHIIQFNYVLEKVIEDINPNLLTFYLYELSDYFHSFFHKTNVINSKNNTGFFVCKLTKKILKIGFKILGLKLLNKM